MIRLSVMKQQLLLALHCCCRIGIAAKFKNKVQLYAVTFPVAVKLNEGVFDEELYPDAGLVRVNVFIVALALHA